MKTGKNAEPEEMWESRERRLWKGLGRRCDRIKPADIGTEFQLLSAVSLLKGYMWYVFPPSSLFPPPFLPSPLFLHKHTRSPLVNYFPERRDSPCPKEVRADRLSIRCHGYCGTSLAEAIMKEIWHGKTVRRLPRRLLRNVRRRSTFHKTKPLPATRFPSL